MSDSNHPGELGASAREAWQGLPLIKMAQQRSAHWRQLVRGNGYQHRRRHIDASESFVATPNNARFIRRLGSASITVPSN